jgi:hypothetical protein
MKISLVLSPLAAILVLAGVARGDTFLQGLAGPDGLQNEGSQGASARNDRFYTGSDKAFIGEPYDWSGVGLSNDGRWATMISPTYFLSANHYHPAAGSTVTFYTGNSFGSTSFTYTVDSFYYQTTDLGNGSDLCLQRFTTPIDASIAKYSVLSLPNDSAYLGVTNWTYGYPYRVGKNNLDAVEDLDLVSDGYGITRVMYYDYAATGGKGADEAYLESGDSGGPSFAVVNNSLALLGIHFVNDRAVHDGARSGDSFVPFYLSQLSAQMAGGQQVATVAPQAATWKGPASGSYSLASNWTNNIVPNGVNAVANFLGNVMAPSTVTVNYPITLATLNFDSLRSCTISGSSNLILDMPSGTAQINVLSGSHEISVPVVLDSDTSISGGGVLNLSGGVSGNHALTVRSTLTATSIQVDAFTIGGTAAMAVPEPSACVLLGLGILGLLQWAWRRRF